MQMERRASERHVIDALEVSVLCKGRRLRATVLDVSAHGAGLAMTDVSGVNVSETVETDHRGNRAQAIVRRVVPYDDGTFNVGLEYLP